MVSTIVLGLASRQFGGTLPSFLAHYAGDTLWPLVVFPGLGIASPATPSLFRAGLALMACCAVELSQLYHADWIDARRHTMIGRLSLGFGFLWSDVLCYTAGVAAGTGMDVALTRLLNRCHNISPN